jgi:tetratricopeptide (TPR) repeat protein
MIGILIATTFFKQDSSKLPTAYRYRFPQSLPGTGNKKSLVQNEIAFYQKRVSTNPQSGLDSASLARAYLKMARATGQTSWYLLAEQAAKRSLSNLSVNNNGAVLVLARVAQASHDFAQAMRLSNQVLKSQPGNEDALAIIVTSNLAMGKLQAAKETADKLVDRVPTQGSLTLQALVQVAQGQDKEAIQNFKYALAAEEAGETGSSAWTRTLLGQFYYKRGQLELARELYQEALRILPKYPLTLVHLAELETRQGNYADAENYYNQVLTYSPSSSTIFDHVVLRGKARIKQLQGKEKEATAILNQAETLLSQQTASGHGNGSFGHRRELARLLLERVSDCQWRCPLGNRSSQKEARSKDVNEALSLMQAEVNIRRDAQTLETLAWALSISGRFQEAQKVIQEALKLGTREAGIFYRAGTIEKALGHNAQAQAYEKQAKEVDPTFDEQARRILGLGLDLGY